MAADGYDESWHWITPNYYAGTTIPGRNSAWRHRNWRNCLFGDGHVKAIQWRTGRTASNTIVMLPRDKTYFESFCLNLEKQINSPFGIKRCGDVAGLTEATAATWIPD